VSKVALVEAGLRQFDRLRGTHCIRRPPLIFHQHFTIIPSDIDGSRQHIRTGGLPRFHENGDSGGGRPRLQRKTAFDIFFVPGLFLTAYQCSLDPDNAFHHSSNI
jgi:hypothetical protein